MRPATFEEREDLCRRAGEIDLLDFVKRVQSLARRNRMRHAQLLSVWLHGPKPTDLPEAELLWMRNKLAEEGREMTPQEVEETAERALCKVRNWLRELGWSEDEIPD